ncbi:MULTISPECIES: hypothetical protein [Rhodococcus]|uniref:hypothetical protein n=1 Tax=Rhodococcus TaxID=1827 RepID=UPI0015546ECE|nr:MULTISPECIES: hypothetical protein [Rhodococcus]MDI9962413.1 hypothetical protein [Rhodococcus sp. IEGM 1251]MDV8125601.1 hypothetical protein [Rhodococcus sp. IEGM 1304]QQM25148.1 hypothetical protein I7X09_22550 [Rhodococcus sp. P-2]
MSRKQSITIASLSRVDMGMGSSVIGPTNMDVSVPVIRPSSGHRWAMCSLPTANLGSVGALRQGISHRAGDEPAWSLPPAPIPITGCTR